MSTLDRLSRMRALYEQGDVTPAEMAIVVLHAILEGKITEFEVCRDLVSPDLTSILLKQIQVIESNEFVDYRVTRFGPSDKELKERAVRLRPVYERIFSQMKSYLGNDATDESASDF